jgi:hypothetical protein
MLHNSTLQSKMTGHAWPVSLLFSMDELVRIPHFNYYGDNNETPTMPAK